MLERLAPLIAVAVLTSSSARAHHGVSAPFDLRDELHSSLTLDTRAGAFAIRGRSGQWQSLDLRAEYALAKALSLAAELPFARSTLAGGTKASGLGDVEASLKVLMFATPQFEVSAGVFGTVPTGDDAHGLGSGHVTLGPSLSASARPLTPLAVHLLVGHRSVAGRHAHGKGPSYGSDLFPHDDRELFGRASISLILASYFAAIGIDAIHSQSVDLGDALSGSVDVGATLGAFHLAAGGELPLAGRERFSWRGHAVVAYQL